MQVVPNKDPFLQLLKKQYDGYVEDRSKKAVFNFRSPVVLNMNSVSENPESDLKTNIQLMKQNPNYTSKTHYDIPSNPKAQCKLNGSLHTHFTQDMGQKLLTENYVPITTKFNEAHPVRASIPHRGPGVDNLESPGGDGSYVRVAGLISQIGYELINISLPRWLPVFLDVMFALDHQKNHNPVAGVDYEALKKRVDTYIQTMTRLLYDLDSKKRNDGKPLTAKQKMETAIKLSTSLESKLKISVQESTLYRAKCELAGDTGLCYLSAINVFNILNGGASLEHISPFIRTFNELYVATATETMSYTRTKNACPYIKGGFGYDVNKACKIRTDNKAIQIKEIYRAKQGDNADILTMGQAGFNAINQMRIDLKDSIRPTSDYIDSYVLKIDINIYRGIKPSDMFNGYMQNVSKIDRSNMSKSHIKRCIQDTFPAIRGKKPKLNGFQYQLKYSVADKAYSVYARYPQAPQILIKSDSLYDFDISIELAAAKEKGKFDIRVIAVREMGGFIPEDAELQDHLDNFSRCIKFSATCHFNWEYNAPDGLIMTFTNGTSVYVRQHPTTDYYYDIATDAPCIMASQYIDGLKSFTKNEWASKIFENHVKYKTNEYKKSLKLAAESLMKSDIDPGYRLPDNLMNLTIEERQYLYDPGPIYPKIRDCYNLALSYTDFDEKKVRQSEHIDLAYVDEINRYFHERLLNDQHMDDQQELERPVLDPFFQ